MIVQFYQQSLIKGDLQCGMTDKRSRIQVVEMSYLRSACVPRIDGESNERTYNIFGMLCYNEGMKCEVVEGVKCNTLRLLCHTEGMAESDVNESMVYTSMVDAMGVRGRMTSVKQGNTMLESEGKG